jgi:hypothetical protein
MKRIVFFLAIIITAGNFSRAQSSYNQELEKAAAEISKKISSSNKKSVAVLDFENSNKQVSELGSWLSSVFTTHLENNCDNSFVVKNRNDIEKAIQQIKSESGSGAYDSKTIQRLGEISGSDVIVYGEITLMDNEITVNIRTKNISLNTTIGGVLVSFVATDGMRTKYDNHLESKNPPAGNTTTSGNGASGEGSARTSKNPKCRETQTGDYCFQNNTKWDLTVTFKPSAAPGFYSRSQSCTLQPGQKQCFFDIYNGAATYHIGAIYSRYGADNYTNTEGSLYVEACKEKTFIIK